MGARCGRQEPEGGDFPADPSTGIGLIVTQFRADIGPDLFEKLVGVTHRVEGAPSLAAAIQVAESLE